jgi:type II secretion system protein G
MKYSARKGFTLVEIMIVVAIIGIIIAIAVPAFLRARENSRGQACQENLSKIDGAKEQYALEFKLSNGGTVTMDNLINPPGTTSGQKQGYLKQEPACPSGGTYTVNPIGTNPTCSIGSSNAPFTPHVLP